MDRRPCFLRLRRLESVEASAEVLDVILQRSERRVFDLLQNAHQRPSQRDDSSFEGADVLQVRGFVLACDVEHSADAGEQAFAAVLFELLDALELAFERVQDE